MGYNSLSKEAAVTHMGRKADSTETGFVLPVLREKRQGVTLVILGKDPTSLEIIMVTLVVLGQIRRALSWRTKLEPLCLSPTC